MRLMGNAVFKIYFYKFEEIKIDTGYKLFNF